MQTCRCSEWKEMNLRICIRQYLKYFHTFQGFPQIIGVTIEYLFWTESIFMHLMFLPALLLHHLLEWWNQKHFGFVSAIATSAQTNVLTVGVVGFDPISVWVASWQGWPLIFWSPAFVFALRSFSAFLVLSAEWTGLWAGLRSKVKILSSGVTSNLIESV